MISSLLRNRATWVLSSIVIVASLIVGVLAADPLSAAFALLAFGLLAATQVRLRHTSASPAVLFAALTLAVAIGGLIVGNSLGVGGSGAVTNTLTPGQLAWTFNLFAVVTACLLLPSAVLVPRLAPQTPEGLPAVPAKFDRLLVTTSSALALLCVLAVGPGWIISRSSRFADTSTVSNLAYLAALGGLVLLGAPLARLRGWRKIAVAPAMLVYTAIFFSAASRYLCLLPLCLFAGLLFAGVRQIRLAVAGAVAGALSLLLLPIPLFLRGSPLGGGVIPYLQWLGQFSLSNGNIASSFNNLLIGFRISGATALTEPPIPPIAFWVSVNPLPGSWAGWDYVWPNLRLNPISPYSGVGELGNQGWILCIVGSLMLGILLAAVHVLGTRIGTGPVARILATAVLAIVLIDAVQFTQYNLRTAFRLLYYAIAFECAALGVALICNRVARGKTRDARHRAAPATRYWARTRA